VLLRSISFRRFLFFLDFRFLFPIWAQSFPTPSRSRTKRSQLPNSSSTSESIWIKVCPAINSVLLHSFMFMVKTSFFKIVFNCFFSKIVKNLFWNTVKPVYNGQPWDSKKLAVVQKWPLSRGWSWKVTIYFGWLGIRPVVIDRWPLFG
jgi:hypothetical protein